MRKTPSSRPENPTLILHVGPGLLKTTASTNSLEASAAAIIATARTSANPAASQDCVLNYSMPTAVRDCVLNFSKPTAAAINKASDSLIDSHHMAHLRGQSVMAVVLNIDVINKVLETLYAKGVHRSVVLNLHWPDGSVSEHWMCEAGYLEDWPFGLLESSMPSAFSISNSSLMAA